VLPVRRTVDGTKRGCPSVRLRYCTRVNELCGFVGFGVEMALIKEGMGHKSSYEGQGAAGKPRTFITHGLHGNVN